MFSKRLGALTILALGIVLSIGVVQASAAGSTQVLKFRSANQTYGAVGFNVNDPNAIPPVGGQFIVHIVLENGVPQFGKPTGARVGRVLLDCTFLTAAGFTGGDGICSGIAHVPDGYITFGGNGGFSNGKVNYYAITGGVGHYVNDRGEIRTVKGGGATITLYSP